MAEDFLNDVDKMYDFLNDNLTREKFTDIYSSVPKADYDLTLKKLNENIAMELAYLMRKAENMLIEENTYFDNEETNPYKNFKVTGEQLKSRVYEFVNTHLSKEEKEEFEEWCEGMAC